MVSDPTVSVRDAVRFSVFSFCVILLVVSLAIVTPSARATEKADFFGITTVGQLANAGEAKEAQDLGIHNVRVDLAWYQVQPSACDGSTTKSLNFAPFDTIVKNAAEKNITLIADLYRTRVGEGCDTRPFPVPGTSMYTAWEQENSSGYVWSVVQRYGFSGTYWAENPSVPYHPIRIWEVWNEQNHAVNNPEAKLSSLNTERYAKLLIATSSTIRNAQTNRLTGGQTYKDVDTKVLMGGLDTYSEDTPAGTYFDQLYPKSPSGYTATELHNSFDGLSYHPYALTEGTSRVKEHIANAETVLSNHGDSSKTLWITEIGWPVMKLSSTPSDELQAESLTQIMPWIYINSGTKIKYAAWYDNQDLVEKCESWSCWDSISGLKKSNGIKRPAWCAYADIIQVNFCNPYPFSWPNEHNYNEELVNENNLGGEKIGDPSISSWEAGRLDAFARGSNNALWHKWYTPGTGWSSWASLFGTLTSGPDAVSWGKNRIDVMAQKDSSHLYHYYWNGSTWNSEVIEGSIYGDPTVSSWESGRFDLFVRGTNNQLWHRAFTGGSWTAWEPLGGISNYASPSPDAVSWGPNRVDVVFLNGTTVEHYYWTGTSWGSDNLGGWVCADPTITSTSSEHLDVFVKGCVDGGLWRDSFAPGIGWSGWSPMYGRPASGPDAVSSGKNRIDLVVQDYLANGSIMHGWTGE